MPPAARIAIRVVLVVILVLVAWTAYANVFSDDKAVRERAEKVARASITCPGGCDLTGYRGSRGFIHMRITFMFHDGSRVEVTCRRPYLAFGEHACTAAPANRN